MSPISVLIDPSQFPDAVRRDLLDSLRIRRINHKFHYDSFKQAQKWLALHEAYSPARNDAHCATVYDRCFAETASRIQVRAVHLVGLGCGGGQKDTRLLQILKKRGKKISYTPSDVSIPLVLVAHQAALPVAGAENIFPCVCDLTSIENGKDFFARYKVKAASRLVTFFGMIPNFEPQNILPKLAALLSPKDHLLFSANLAPGRNYADGVKKVLPLYDNALTREWLQTFLEDLGVEKKDGELRFFIEDFPAGKIRLKRIVADFVFSRRCEIKLPEERFTFQQGGKIRLFYSFRHTPKLVKQLLAQTKIEVVDEWISRSEEEGVFLCRKSG
ncbi:MAG: L-histidine N(alpha)-methyltransferase [Verrucomicrobiota bacterium]